MRGKGKCFLCILMTAVITCSLWGCGSGDTTQITEIEKLTEDTAQTDTDSNLDQIDPDPADDNWYTKGSVYKNDSGHYVEVFFDDEGMLEFAVDGLSLYYSSVDKVQYENDWRIYECEDGIAVVYYPGDPAHLEIYGGDYEGLYEEGGDKME